MRLIFLVVPTYLNQLAISLIHSVSLNGQQCFQVDYDEAYNMTISIHSLDLHQSSSKSGTITIGSNNLQLHNIGLKIVDKLT